MVEFLIDMTDTDCTFLPIGAWEATFRGWHIVDVAVRDLNVVYLALRQSISDEQASLAWEHDIPSRLAALYLDETDPGEQWSHQGLTGFALTRCTAGQEPHRQGIALSLNGDALAMGSGHNAMENVNIQGEQVVLHRGRSIAGRPYAVGMFRDVYRRVDVGRWELLARGLPDLARAEMSATKLVTFGFHDIDGFAEDDLYAVGGKGDVWHYDSLRWSPCKFPSKLPLFTVCCAGDGQVYISGEGGTLFQGRGDTWRKIWKADMSIPYNDTRWFDGTLWLASDYVLDWLVDGQVGRANQLGARGHLDAADGILVVASLDEVRMFDGRLWRVLVRPFQ